MPLRPVDDVLHAEPIASLPCDVRMRVTDDAFRLLHVDDDPAVLDLTSVYLDRELDLSVTTLAETSPEAAISRAV